MRTEIEFASHPGVLCALRTYVRDVLGPLPLSPKEVDMMVLGLDEACTNIIRYAYAQCNDQLILLSAEVGPQGVEFRLRDFGKPCEVARLQAHHMDFSKPGGLGLHLIRSAFTVVEYRPQKDGTELVLRKIIPAMNPGALPEAAENVAGINAPALNPCEEAQRTLIALRSAECDQTRQ